MRILYFTQGYTPHDHRFVTAIKENGHKVDYLSLSTRSNATETRQLPESVRQFTLNKSTKPVAWVEYPGLVNKFKKIVLEWQPDVIHAGPIQSTAAIAAASGCYPLVSMSWGSDMLMRAERSSLQRCLTRYVLQKSQVLIADCQAVVDKAATFGFVPERTIVFPWGVDLQHFKPGQSKDLRKSLHWQDKFVILSSRSWEPIYGVDTVVKAFVLAAKQYPGLRMILLGQGRQEKDIKRILADNHLLQSVHFGGQVGYSDLPQYYRSADLYVSASQSDGSSVSLLESMACGLPSVVSDIPGNREWISPDVQGWLFKTGNFEMLAEYLNVAASDRAVLTEMGRSARLVAVSRADWAKNSKKLNIAYQMALELSKVKGIG